MLRPNNRPLRELKLFTHNCSQRLVCGRLGSVASRMALDDNQATTIDGTRKGAGIVKAQGEVAHIQYYFTNQDWIQKWFVERGMSEKGFDPKSLISGLADNDDIDLGEDEEITMPHDVVEMDFHDMHREVDRTKDQKFEEI